MLDDSDSDAGFFAVLFSSGWTGFIAPIIVAIIFIVVLGNHEECAKKRCPDGKPSRLLDHQCLCVEPPKTN